MSQKTRGQQATIRISVDGVVQQGSMVKVRDWTSTPRTTLNEDDYIGEDETDIDLQHHGWDIGFSVDTTDDAVLSYTDSLIARYENNQAPPVVTITVIYNFPDPTVRARMTVYSGVYLKQDEETIGGRKEIIKGKFSGKCKKRQLMNA